MELPPLTHYYFSSNPETEKTCRKLCWMLFIGMIVILLIFWQPLRSTRFTYALVSFTLANAAVEVFFRIVTTLGSEGFFLVFLSVVYWTVNKSLGFWGLVVMPLSIFLTSEIPKDIIRLPRPDVRGVSMPTYTFPSGHTTGAVSVWGYLAIRIKRRWFWIWSLTLILLVGLSRTMLGYHFFGDVLGGFVTGMVFLAFFFWVGVRLIESGWGERIPFHVLLLISLILPLAMSFIPATFAPRFMGYLAGASAGYLLEREKLEFHPSANWLKQLGKAFMGLVILAAIMLGLSAVMRPDVHLLTFLQCFLATFWVIFLAPHFFIKYGLA